MTPANAAAWISLGVLTLALALQKIASFDYWWHLRTGQLIAETGAVPKLDPFTFTVLGARWIDIHWLFQVGLYRIFSLGGHDAVVLAKGALLLLLVALLAVVGYRRDRPAVAVATLALVLLVAALRFVDRPELLSFVLLAGILALFSRFERTGDAWIYGVVALQLVWVNSHGLFALGIAVCAIHLVGELSRPLHPARAAIRPERVRRLVAVTVLACAASLANPNFLDAALYPLQQLGMIGLPGQRSAGPRSTELQPLVTGWRQLASPYLALLGLLAAQSAAAMLLNWRRLRVSDALLWGAFALLALAAIRNVALFAIVAGAIAVRNLNEILDDARARRGWNLAATAGCCALVLALAAYVGRGGFYPSIGVDREPGLGVAEAVFPVGAAEWIARERPAGPICHHMMYGGYLLWRLYPDYPVMADGRLEVFGGDMTRELRLDSVERFRALDARYRFGMVLVQFGYDYPEKLLGELYRDPDWILTYVDTVGALLVRRGSGVSFASIDVDAPDLFPPLEAEPSKRDYQRLLARHKFYSEIGRPRDARRSYDEIRGRYPELFR